VNTARQLALGAGGTIETRSQNPSLDELRNGATGGGILIALGVLAMTVGLVRGEAAGDLRTLTATGAHRRIRRTLTAATAGGLGLRDASGTLVDSVGYGTATNAFVEGSAAPAPPAAAAPGKSAGRKPDGHDTDDNAADFSVLTSPTPGASNG